MRASSYNSDPSYLSIGIGSQSANEQQSATPIDAVGPDSGRHSNTYCAARPPQRDQEYKYTYKYKIYL
jgi:hypothetical protein